MPSVVIVTDQCYLLAEAINFITINEVDDSDDTKWFPSSGRKKLRLSRAAHNKISKDYMMERKPYHIIINFIPKGNPNTSGSGGLNKSNSMGSGDSTVNGRVHG